MPRLNLHLTPDVQQALDELVVLLPDVDNKSVAARRAIVEARDKYEILARVARMDREVQERSHKLLAARSDDYLGRG